MDEVKKTLQALLARLEQVEVKLDPTHRHAQIRELEAKSMHADFWSDPSSAQSTMKRLSDLRDQEEELAKLHTDLTDAISVSEIVEQKDISKLTKRLDNLELSTFLNGPYDSSNAILSIHAGQGGTEAMDWVSMLLRMYLKYSQSRGWDVEILDQTPGEEAGLKSVTLTISGSYAYGYLALERGTHRLVRQSPFNADGLRQTSFALVEILPQLPELNSEIILKPEEISFESFRATGHGGQNVNKVSTAVRLTHIPTGITVQCQTQRYQEQNRKLAESLLKAKLWQREMEKRAETTKQLKGAYKTASWGNQIRSYVLHPYKLVKDLRTNVETNQAELVLAGELDLFIEAQIKL